LIPGGLQAEPGALEAALHCLQAGVQEKNQSPKAETKTQRPEEKGMEALSQQVRQSEPKLTTARCAAESVISPKQSQDALPCDAELLRLIADLVPHGIFAKDAAGRHIFANAALAEMAGLSIEEMLGKDDFELVADKAQAEAYRADDRAVIESGHKMIIPEESRTDLSGRTRFLETIKIPFKVAGTGEPAVLGVCMDITERKRYEASLQESEERFRSMFNAAATGIAISTPQGQFLQANGAYCRMLGFTEEELRTRDFASLTHPEDLTVNLVLRDELLAGKRANFVMEKRYLKKNGDIVWTRQSVAAVRAASSEIVMLIVVAEDITERKRVEASLSLFRTLADRSSDGIEVIDPETGHFLDVNETTCRRLGYQRREMLSMSVADVDAGAIGTDPSAWRNSIEIVRQSGFRVVETLHKRKDGSTFPVEVSVQYVKLDRDYLIASVRDITERKQAEQKIKEYTQELERSNDELQQFAYVASHDLQEPLRAVVGCIQMIDESNTGAFDERSRELMGHVIDGAKRMQMLINDLLAYSRVGSKGISRKQIDVAEMVKKAMHQLSVAIAESGAVITIDSLPTMWADPVQITQLFQNLIANAIKFRTELHPQIHVSAQQIDGEMIFSVRDNGIGIAPEYHEKIFGIFRRLLSRRDYPGTGIGLAICKKIVERHEGRIWVESGDGEGANFRFKLNERPAPPAA
jgi:PAS domain S-box-containing protein